METEQQPCDLCPLDDKPWYRTILRGEQSFYVCIDCYVKMLEEILDLLVDDERKRGTLIFQEFKKAQRLNERLEWDFERPSLIDCGRPSDEEFLPEYPEGLMTMKQG